jgi:outer membrane protein OmpA-like peptidoglycan-associated protein
MRTEKNLARSVLVVLEQGQREARAQELARLARPGIDVVHEESPDVALDLVATQPPPIVLVGMTIGAMEGLEFLALLLKRSPGFQGKVVVLPDKGDPFPPMLQGRDPVTKKSTTTAIDFAGIEALVAEVASSLGPVAAPAPAPSPPAPAPSPRAPAVATPTPAAVPAPSSARAPRPAPTAPSRTPVLAAGVGAILLLGVGGILLLRKGTEHPTTAPSAIAAPTQPRETPTIAVGAASERPREANAEPSPTEASRPMTTLPLTFAINSSEFQVGNQEELDAIVAELKRSLGAGVIEIGGHTSTEGPDDFNRDLSLRRAASVKRLLVGRGIPENRMVVQAYQTSAAPSSAPPESNRRVTLRILR